MKIYTSMAMALAFSLFVSGQGNAEEEFLSCVSLASMHTCSENCNYHYRIRENEPKCKGGPDHSYGCYCTK